MNTQQDNLEKAFYADGYKLGMKAVESGLNDQAMNDLINQMHTAIDSLIDTLFTFAKQQGQKIDCTMGCQWCCHQPVFALDYELEHLKSYVNKYFDEETISEIKQKAQEKEHNLKGLEEEELLNTKHPCPLLSDGVCVAYEARPMACRIYLSSDVKTCLTFFNSPKNKTNYPALLDLPMRLGRMMNEGFKAALKTDGYIAKEYRIEEKFL